MASISERTQALGVRRERHNAGFRAATLADLARLPISCDPDTDRQASGPTVGLTARHRLTLYHAAYLELEQRRGPLAPLDQALQAAASAEGVVLLG